MFVSCPILVFNEWCTCLTFKGFWVLFQALALISNSKAIKISVSVMTTSHLIEGLETTRVLYLCFQVSVVIIFYIVVV